MLFELSAFIAVLGPIFSLVFYAAILKSGRFQLREDRAADNLYYLGFLFTLTSLGVGLYRYDSEISGVENIISDLGVGLTSTILGLFLRILFLQLRVDPDEVSEDAKEQLSRAIEGFRADVNNISEVSRQAQTTLTQQFQENAASYKAIVVELAANTKKLGTQVNTFNNKVSDIEIPRDLLVTKVNEAFSAFVSVVNDVATKISKASDNVKNEFDNLSSKVSSIKIDEKTVMAQVDDQAAAIVKRISNTINALGPLEKLIQSFVSKFEENLDAIERITAKLDFASSVDVEFTNSMVKLNGNVQALSEYSAQLINMPGILLSVANDIRVVGDNLKDGSRAVSENLSGAAVTVKSIEVTAIDVSEGLKSVTKELNAAIKEIIEVANRQ